MPEGRLPGEVGTDVRRSRRPQPQTVTTTYKAPCPRKKQDSGEREFPPGGVSSIDAKWDGRPHRIDGAARLVVERQGRIGLRTQSVGWRRGAAGVAGLACVAALVAVVLLATSAGGANGGYTVRAIFDDAGNIISGEDVKIDGVKVGTVGLGHPHPAGQGRGRPAASATPGFQDFRADASCTVRPQALIGEKFVDCLPTQPRVEGTPLPPPLRKIPKARKAPASGCCRCRTPTARSTSTCSATSRRLPERQRLTIILNELGAGLAGRGKRSERGHPPRQPGAAGTRQGARDPRRREPGAGRNSPSTPTRRWRRSRAVRKQVADFIVQSNTVAQASARHLGRARTQPDPLPAVPAPARPRDGTPRALRRPDDAGVHRTSASPRPAINQAFTHLPAFSNSSSTFFQSLGKTAKQSGPALVATKPLLNRLRSFGAAAKPFTSNFSELLTSLRKPAAWSASSTSSSWAPGRPTAMTRSGTSCAPRAWRRSARPTRSPPRPAAAPNCPHAARATKASTAKAAPSAARGTTSLVMARTLAVLKGATPAQALAKYPGSVPSRAERCSAVGAGELGTPTPSRSAARARAPPTTRPRQKAPAPAACSSTTSSATERCDDPRPPLLRRLLLGVLALALAAARNEVAAEPASPTPTPPAGNDHGAPPHRQAAPADRLGANAESTPAPAPPRRARRSRRRRRSRPSTRRGVQPAQPAAHARVRRRRPGGHGRRDRRLLCPRRRSAPTPSLAVGADAVAAARARILDRRACRASSSKASASRRSCCRSTRPPGTAYGIPWQVLAAINEVETDYGRDLSVSSAGAEGWMQFLPASWAQYGVTPTATASRTPTTRPTRSSPPRGTCGRRRGDEHQGGGLLLQPLAGLRRLGDAARPAARRHATRNCSARSPA